MNFYELQPNGKKGKDAYQACNDIHVISCDQNPRKSTEYTNFYGMQVQTPNGPANVSLSGRSPLTPGVHSVVVSVNDHHKYGRLYTFKRAPKNDFGSGGSSGGQSSQGGDIQERIAWNSAVNNACHLLALKGVNQDFVALRNLADSIYDIILGGPKLSALPAVQPAYDNNYDDSGDPDIPF